MTHPFLVYDNGQPCAVIYGEGRWPSWSLWVPPESDWPLFDWSEDPDEDPEIEAERQYDIAHA